uniref:Epstein-Barr virus-like n=1 Tax=Oryza sativa subsp. indica TaxID=39946 RepID=C8TFK7_ORYSI|nr:Epstein-Barr virus-like [Oryza sativa Indica Group]
MGKLAAANARLGGGPSSGGARPEMGGGGGARVWRRGGGRKHGRARRVREMGEEVWGSVFMGEGGADVAEIAPRFHRRRGGGERERRDGIQTESWPLNGRARGRGGGGGRRRGRGVRARRGGATWSGEGGGAGGGWSFGSNGRR